MAFDPNTGLEDPGTGNPNTSGIISGNVQTLNTWIDPATPVGDIGFDALERGLYKGGAATLAPAASVALDMAAHKMAEIELDQATTFTFANLNGGQIKLIRVTNNGSAWGMTWPAAVVWAGPPATTSTIGKTGLVEMIAFSPTLALGRWTEEA